jgi:DNA primase
MTGSYPDYGAIRDQARFETVLANYGLETRGHGAERMIWCPFHDDRTPSCAINLEKKVFHCFACSEKGTILDFVATMERGSIAEAARLLATWCDVSGPSPRPAATKRARPERLSGNQPLGFELPLNPRHPYLTERGMSQDTVARFELGYCDHGSMKGRVCIPIHDQRGRLVAYAGRWPGSSPPPNEARYRLPRGFRKRLVLFNVHRVANASHLVVVEGFWSVFRLDVLGIPAVALMGCTMSEEQEDIIRRSAAERFTLLLDGDQAGRSAVSEILPRLARHRFVHAPDIPEGAEPDTMDEATLLAAIRTTARK